MTTPPRPGADELVRAAESASPYLIPARVAFITIGSKRHVFWSVLEARWALAFEGLHLGWSYEPAVFPLPGGGQYTPDFYLDGIGWVEVKPSWEGVLGVRRKLVEFAERAAEVVSEARARRFFTFAIGRPAFVHLASEPPPVVEWFDDGVAVLPVEACFRTFASETGRELFDEVPWGYRTFADRVFAEAERARIGGPANLAESLLVDAVEQGASFHRMVEGGPAEALRFLRSRAAAKGADDPSDREGAARLLRSVDWYAHLLGVKLD